MLINEYTHQSKEFKDDILKLLRAKRTSILSDLKTRSERACKRLKKKKNRPKNAELRKTSKIYGWANVSENEYQNEIIITARISSDERMGTNTGDAL